MQYTIEVPFTGNVAKAFDIGIAALTSIGFRITEKKTASLDFEGPGMTGTRQSPLLGATQIRVLAGRNNLAPEAELGGVARMARFIALFPASLSLLLFVVFVGIAAAATPEQLGMVALIVSIPLGINIVIWLVLAPFLNRHIKGRSCRAIDALLHNMAVAGDEAIRQS